MSNPNENPLGAAIDAETAFTLSLSPEQRELKAAYEARMDNLAGDQVSRMVDALGAHFPGLKPAIEAIASVSHGDLTGGSCACRIDFSKLVSATPKDHFVAPPDATPEWPVDENYDLVRDERLELLAGMINHLPAQRAVLLALADHIACSGQDWPRCCSDLYPGLKLTLL